MPIWLKPKARSAVLGYLGSTCVLSIKRPSMRIPVFHAPVRGSIVAILMESLVIFVTTVEGYTGTAVALIAAEVCLHRKGSCKLEPRFIDKEMLVGHPGNQNQK